MPVPLLLVVLCGLKVTYAKLVCFCFVSLANVLRHILCRLPPLFEFGGFGCADYGLGDSQCSAACSVTDPYSASTPRYSVGARTSPPII